MWTPEQLGSLLDHTADDRLAVRHSIGTVDVRRGEACGLRRVDLDLDRGGLQVAQQVVHVGHRTEISAEDAQR